MKNKTKKNHAKKHGKNRENRPRPTLVHDSGGTKRYLILDDMDDLSTSGVLEAEPVPYETRKKCIRYTLLLLAAGWVLFLRFVPLHILVRILVLLVLSFLASRRIYWELMYRFCTGQTAELRWTLSDDALLLGDNRIPYETITNIQLASAEEVLKHHQPGVYAYIRTDTRLFVFFSRRTGTEREIEDSESEVTVFLFMLGQRKREHLERTE